MWTHHGQESRIIEWRRTGGPEEQRGRFLRVPEIGVLFMSEGLQAFSRLRLRPWLERYGFAILVTGIALLVRLPLWPVLGHTVPYVTFVPAIMLAGYRGGLGPGLLATLLSGLAANFFLVEPILSLATANWVDTSGEIAFLLSGAFMSWLNELLHRSARRSGANEERLRVTLRSIADGVIVTDKNGKVCFLNPVAQLLTGWTEEEATGKPLSAVFAVYHEDTGSPATNPVERVQQDNLLAPTAGHLVLRSRNGHLHPIDDSAAPIRDEIGNPAGIVLVFRDVSERKKTLRSAQRARDKTAESLAQLDALLTHAPIGFACFDRRLHATRVNQYLADLAGCKPANLLGLSPVKVLPFDPAQAKTLLATALQQGKVTQGLEITTGTGEGLRSWLVSFYPVRSLGQSVDLVGVVLVEISDRKRLEAELRRHAEELGRADRRKDLFLAMLSHELRAPLAPIRNACSALALQDPDSLAGQSAQLIDRQVGQLSRLVEDLLDTARVGRGLVSLRLEEVELSATVGRVVESIRPSAEDREHQLTVEIATPEARFLCDPVRLQQVLSNLLTNAVKYTPRGGSICFTATVEDQAVIFRVRDNGAGIRPDLLPQIFEPFHRGDHGADGGIEGLGLGLSLVRGLVELHGGKVIAHSAGPGLGSEFVVRLPLRFQPVWEKTPREATTLPPVRSGKRILIVDDSNEAAESLALLLRLKGNVVEVAGDGPTGLTTAERFQPEVVFLDINLPGTLDGYDVAREMRAITGLAGVRLVALTGMGKDDRRSAEAGFAAHLVKPVSIEDLQEAITGTPEQG